MVPYFVYYSLEWCHTFVHYSQVLSKHGNGEQVRQKTENQKLLHIDRLQLQQEKRERQNMVTLETGTEVAHCISEFSDYSAAKGKVCLHF